MTQFCPLAAMSIETILLVSPTILIFSTISTIDYCQFVTNRVATTWMLFYILMGALPNVFSLHFFKCHKSIAAPMFELKFLMLIKLNFLSTKFQIGSIECVAASAIDFFIFVCAKMKELWKYLLTLKRFVFVC